MILTFAFGKCYSRGALRFLVVLILIGTRAVLITGFPLELIFSCAGFQFLPIWDFSSHGIRVLNVKSWGGGELSMTWFNI